MRFPGGIFLQQAIGSIRGAIPETGDSELVLPAIVQSSAKVGAPFFNFRGESTLPEFHFMTSFNITQVNAVAGNDTTFGAAFSPDSAFAASGGTDGAVRLWKVDSGDRLGGDAHAR